VGYKPIGKNLLLRPLTEEETREGVVVRADIGAPRDDVLCEVLGVGPLAKNETRVGAKVLIPRTLNRGGDARAIFINEDDVLCEIEA
jgi:co-chaperonin GroES (HSP10)